MNPFKVRQVQLFGNETYKSKLHTWRN